LGGGEDEGLAGDVGDGDFDERAFVVLLFAFEAEAAAGHVLALNDVVAALGMADEGGIADLGARMLAAVDARSVVAAGGRRQGEDGGARLPSRLRAGVVSGGLRGGEILERRLHGGGEGRGIGRRRLRSRGRRDGRGDRRGWRRWVLRERDDFRVGRDNGGSGFPKSGKTAVFAETEQAFIGGEEDGFRAAVVQLLDGFAGAARERDEALLDFGGSERGEFGSPKIELGIDESQAVGVDAVGGAHLADDADGGFGVAIGAAEDELLLGRKLVMGNDAGAVEAEEDGVGGLGENLAIKIAADQDDGDFLRDAAGDAHNLLWQERGQSGARGGPISYLVARMNGRVFRSGTREGATEKKHGKRTGLKTRHYKRRKKKEGTRRGCPSKKNELLLLRGRGGGGGGVADGVAVDDEFDAAIALAAFGGVVGSDGLRFAEAARGDGRTGDALLGEKIADGIGAALGELLIEIIATDAVGVAFDLEREAGMREDDAGNFGELFARAGLERVAAGVKEDIGHVDDEAAGGIAGLQNGIQLREELRAKLGFFGFGLRGGLAGFFGFGLRGGAVTRGLRGSGFSGLLLR